MGAAHEERRQEEERQEEGRQEERQALERLLAISQHRKMLKAQYFEQINDKYEFRLEYEQSTLFIALDIVGGKSFRRQVCDEGQHRLKNGLLAGEIFQAFKLTPKMCQVDLHRGVLVIKKKQIEMNELTLCGGIRQEIKFGRVARECLKHLREDKERLRKYQEKEKEYLKEIEELRAQLGKPVPKPSIDPESLVMETPHRRRFLVRANTITLLQQSGIKHYQVLLGEVLPKRRPFVLLATITSTASGDVGIGVVDRRTQKDKQSSYNSGNAVCYYGDSIYYSINGKRQQECTNILFSEETELRMKVELDKGMATFTIEGEDFPVYSDILSDPNRQFVPYFEMCDKGDRVEWRME